MISLQTLEDIASLAESEEVECKLAVGRDGKGQLPTDLWPSYSAFANTAGGTIILGVRENNRIFELVGLANPEKLRTDLFNQLNNPQKVSCNLITAHNVEILKIDGHWLLSISVPAAGRRRRPVHINSNPLTGTYRRSDDGDRLCDPETVKRMLAEQIEDTRDNRVLVGFDRADISGESVLAYRQAMRDRTPTHPFLDVDDTEFLFKIGAMRRDRENKSDGLTVAGLLMFGLAENIMDEFPHYMLDFQERDRPQAEARWIDRLTVDGTWSGNLFDFYRRVYRKLVADLKVPFAIVDGERQDETPVHQALRESIVNTIVHADYSARASILVVKRPDMFGFRNPGRMRIPVSQAILGGESDGRNRILQKMFLLIGAGEQAGSGVPRIHKGWAEQHWTPPRLYEVEEPSEQTRLELRMSDLIPGEALDRLRGQFGTEFEALTPEQRLILATAAVEGMVTHARMQSVCGLHPVDLSRMIQSLVQDGFLYQTGRTKGATYRLPLTVDSTADPLFGTLSLNKSASEGSSKPLEPAAKPLELAGKPLGPDQSQDAYDSVSLRDDTPLWIIDDIENLDSSVKQRLSAEAESVNQAGKVPVELVRKIVILLCSNRFISARALAFLLKRNEVYLRQSILTPLVQDGLLTMMFPTAKSHPRQAYTSTPGDMIEDGPPPT